MPSSPSNPKHKLRKCNVKSKRKNKRHEKILIEKLKELTLSSKNDKKGCNRYMKMQEGGLGVFCSTCRYKRGGGGMFGKLAKSARSILPRVGKKIFKAVATVLLDEGRQLLTRKKNVTQAVKSVAKRSKSNVFNAGKEALRTRDSQISKGRRLNKYQGKTNRKVEKKINMLRNRD